MKDDWRNTGIDLKSFEMYWYENINVTGNPEELGKDVSQDEKNGKVTFVSIYGLDKASEYVKQASELAITLINEAHTDFTTKSAKSTSADTVCRPVRLRRRNFSSSRCSSPLYAGTVAVRKLSR